MSFAVEASAGRTAGGKKRLMQMVVRHGYARTSGVGHVGDLYCALQERARSPTVSASMKN